jgi:hypothetical protein
MRYGDSLSSLSLASACTGGGGDFPIPFEARRVNFFWVPSTDILVRMRQVLCVNIYAMWANMRNEGCSVSFLLCPQYQFTFLWLYSR